MKAIVIFLLMFISTNVFAQQWGVVGGLNSTGGKIEIEGSPSVDRELKFNLGVRYTVDLNDLKFRTGAQLNFLEMSVKGFDEDLGMDLKLTIESMYLMIPLTVQKMLTEQFGLIGGGSISLLLDDKATVEGMGSIDPEMDSVWLTLQVGAIFQINENAAIEAIFDYGLNEMIDDLKTNVISANFVYYFPTN